MPYEIFLTRGKTTKIRHTFTNSRLTDIKLIKAQMSKINQLGGCHGNIRGKLEEKHC